MPSAEGYVGTSGNRQLASVRPATAEPVPGVRLLGSFEFVLDGVPVRVARRKQRVLLALLALHANRVIPVSNIVDALWDGAPPAASRNQIHVHISTIRRLLAGRPEHPVALETSLDGYRLNAPPVEVDTWQFEQAATDGLKALEAGQLQAARTRLQAALSLWRGVPLEGIDGAFASAEATRLEEQRLSVLLRSFDVELALGNYQAVIPRLRPAAAAHPLHEGVWQRLMLALYGAGRSAEALAAYREIRETLVEELGIEPGEELSAAESAILQREPLSALIVRTLLPRQQGQLPGSHRPDPGDQVQPAQAPAKLDHGDAGPWQWPTPRQLPWNVAGFAGRQEQLAKLDQMIELAAGPVPIVICGTAGVGKTALAVYWAHRASHRFPDGQLFVPLGAFRNGSPVRPAQALAQCLRSLGVPADQVPADLEGAAGLYRSLLARARCLIVLDDAADAEQVRPLLPGNPACQVMVTSRYQLSGLAAADGARILPLGVLSPEESVELMLRAGVEEARREPQLARTLARLCAHLPIALRVAAANLVHRPNRTMKAHVAELSGTDRLGVLRIEGDDELAVEAMFEHSYVRLLPAAQRMFRLIGMVPWPGITVEQAAVLASVSEEEAASSLGRLTTVHLVEEFAAGRYMTHDLLRLYASRVTALPEFDADSRAALSTLLEWLTATVYEARGMLYPELISLPPRATGIAPRGFASAEQARAWLNAECSTLVAAITQAAKADPPSPVAWHILDSIRGYFWLTRNMADWFAASGSALTGARAAQDTHGEAAALHSLALAEHASGKLSAALYHYRGAWRLSREVGWWSGAAAALAKIGSVYSYQGKPGLAERFVVQSMRFMEFDGEQQSVDVVALLGTLYRLTEQLGSAAGQYADATELYREVNSRVGEGWALGVLGETYHVMGRIDEAMGLLSQAKAIHRETGNRTADIVTTGNLAVLLADSGRGYRQN